MSTYTPIDPVLLEEADAHQLFQNVALHYLACAGNDYALVERLDSPECARTVWRLWMFLAEIGSNGLNDYLWNLCYDFPELQRTLRDLRAIGAEELADLLETGVCIALEHNTGEFLAQPGAKEWAATLQRKVSVTAETLDRVSMDAGYPRGSEVVARFIRAQRTEL